MTRIHIPMVLLALGVLLGASALPARAGGHFDIDDAYMLDPGRCHYELWGGRIGHDPETVGHTSLACRTGPVEVGFNLDYGATPGDHGWVLGPQLKWTFFGAGPEAPVSAALVLNVVADVTHGGRWGGQWMLPLSWRAGERLTLSANVGRDWSPHEGHPTRRGGLGAEWALNDALSFIAERNRAFGLWMSRAGLRYHPTSSMNIDFSVGRVSSGVGNAVFVGFTHEFDR